MTTAQDRTIQMFQKKLVQKAAQAFQMQRRCLAWVGRHRHPGLHAKSGVYGHACKDFVVLKQKGGKPHSHGEVEGVKAPALPCAQNLLLLA